MTGRDTGTRDFKGNKAHLPSKLCAVCGRTMTWRKAWAKNWDDVKYCSEACRRQKRSVPVSPDPQEPGA